ncbi:extracellular matrix organizing protein FRAS1-like isoform X4 [Poecile atricapillus]|uniref:extracellular matrix organizing protein FRAS1-like isoform X4 n=1 Tax=Poecile atricapillus TaxID=48891 RepID=UPI002739E723|nr:extracellular matrix organizing protein FRAS1-like isoform X4 [Poecile atricapillus]
MELLRKQPPTVAVSRELQLPAGSTAWLTAQHLKAAAAHSGDTAIRFVLRRDPSRGQLQLTTADSPVQISAKGPLQSFTQADINEEDRSPPSIITNKGLVLDENSAKTIRTLQLSATDQDSEASQLQFKVTQQPQLGHLEHVASPGTRISSFSQADLASGSIQYIHTSDVEKHTDAFTFSVSDGTNEVSQTFDITINPVDDSLPIVQIFGMTLQEGVRKSITEFELKATDADTEVSF